MGDAKFAGDRSFEDGLLKLYRDAGQIVERLPMSRIAERWKQTGLRRSDLFATLDRLAARAYIRTVATDDEVGFAITREGKEYLKTLSGPASDCWKEPSTQAVFRLTGRHRSQCPIPGRHRRAGDASIAAH